MWEYVLHSAMILLSLSIPPLYTTFLTSHYKRNVLQMCFAIISLYPLHLKHILMLDDQKVVEDTGAMFTCVHLYWSTDNIE